MGTSVVRQCPPSPDHDKGDPVEPDRIETCFSSVMAPTPYESKPDKRRTYDNTFKAESPRLARESQSARAAAHQLGNSERLLYCWRDQQAATELGSAELARDPEVRALRAE
jgi:transposase